jgi:glycerol kinase
MKKDYILAIDQGTTNTKAIIVDGYGAVKTQCSCPVSIEYPKPGWVEQNPLELWESVQKVINTSLSQIDNPNILAVAVTNQRESILLWDRKTGMPVGPCLVWADIRTSKFLDSLIEQELGSKIKSHTGLMINTLFSASKARWLIKNAENGKQRAEHGELCLGTVDSWILWNMTGGKAHACDISNASRTQLYNINTLKWDDEMSEIFEVPLAVLPQVNQTNAIYGKTALSGSLIKDIPIACLIGDSHGSLFGHNIFEPGYVKTTHGTASSLITPIKKVIISDLGLTTTIAWMINNQILYALEGVLPTTGSVAQWICKILELDDLSALEKISATLHDTEGVYLVPAFSGLGAPYWDYNATGLVCGLTGGTQRAHLARAAEESIAYQVRDLWEALKKETGMDFKALFADGGPAKDNFLMQFQADIIGNTILRNPSSDLSAMGAAFLAGLGIGLWSSLEEIKKLAGPLDSFEPKFSPEKREILYSGWKNAIARSRLNTN